MSHENMFQGHGDLKFPFYFNVAYSFRHHLISHPEISQWSLLLSGRIYAFADCLAVREGTSPRSWVSQPLGPYGNGGKDFLGKSSWLFRWQCTKRWNTGAWTVMFWRCPWSFCQVIWLVTIRSPAFWQVGWYTQKKMWQLLLKVQKLPWDRCWSQKNVLCKYHLNSFARPFVSCF